MFSKKIILLVIFSFSLLAGVQAQVPIGIVKGMFVEVETKDGMNLIGNVKEISSEKLVLEYETYGEMTIKTIRIKSIEQIETKTIKTDGYWHENKNYSRNFYGPTALGMEKGKGYYQNILVVWNHFAYAFTDYFTLGIDFEIVSILARLSGEQLFEDNPMPLTALTPKFSYGVAENVHLGLGAIFLFVPGTDYYFDGGITYLVGTYGDKDRNATLGFGIPFIEGDYEAKSPIMTLSGQYRVSRKISLVSENWFIFPEGDDSVYFIGVQGMRYLARKLTWDFGLGIFAGGGEFTFIPVPYVSIVFPFNRAN